MESRLSSALNWTRKVARRRLSSVVYVVQSQEFTKIGHTRDMRSRLNQIQNGNPHPVQLLAQWPTNYGAKLERRIHSKLWRYHVRGEWFRLPYDVLEGLIGI